MKVLTLFQNPKFKNKKVLSTLISHFLWWSKEDVIKNLDIDISETIIKDIEKAYKEWQDNKKPLEYILWFVEFKWLKFKVNPSVLIPRPETEYMIDEVVEFLRGYPKQVNLLDIWTGCGVLWISIKKFVPEKIKNLILSDISDKALEVAKKNAKKNLWENNDVYFIKSDLLSQIPDKFFQEDFVIVANLPYIPDKVFEENVEDNVKKWEPSIAFLGWENWLNLYRKLLNQLLNRRKKFIRAFFEIMWWQADILTKLYPLFEFKKKKTFHFNIKIVEVSLK